MALNNLMQPPDDQGIAGGLGTLPKKPKLKSAPAAGVAATAPPARGGSLAETAARLQAAYGDMLPAPAPAEQPSAAGRPQGFVSGARAIASPLLRRGEYFPSIDKPAPDQAAPSAPAAGIATPPTPALASPARVNTAAPFQSADPSYNLANAGTGVGTAPASQLKSPAAAAGGIDSGVTLGDGRKLAYGAMAGGVPTFSDGSGGPGSIPATMTKQDIASLGDRLNTVPATAFTQPGAGVVADAAGLPAVSSAGQAATLVRNAQGPKFAMTPEMIAQSDNNAVASGDWRSAAGTAAHNLAVEAAAPSTYLQRTRALDDLGTLRANSAQAVQKAADNTATLRRGAQTDQNALDIANLQGQYGLADTRERALTEAALRKPDQVTLADGTVGLIQPNGAVTRALGADGKPVKVPMTKLGGGLTEKDLNDEAIKLLPQVLGTDPTTGMIKDPNAPGGYRQPTRQEIAAALPAARALLTGQSAPTAKPTLEQFLSAARAKNPGVSDAKLTDYYNKHYGS